MSGRGLLVLLILRGLEAEAEGVDLPLHVDLDVLGVEVPTFGGDHTTCHAADLVGNDPLRTPVSGKRPRSAIKQCARPIAASVAGR